MFVKNITDDYDIIKLSKCTILETKITISFSDIYFYQNQAVQNYFLY